jgi:hypothetical protein
MDPTGHFSRARLGEGETKDRRRISAREQKPEYSGRQNMSLSRPSRGRKGRMMGGRRGKKLVALETSQWSKAIGQADPRVTLGTMAMSEANAKLDRLRRSYVL